MEYSAPRPRIAPHLALVGARSLSEETDDELVRLVLEGNLSAMQVVWSRHAPSARRLLRRRLTQDVDDQLQETFSRVFSNLGDLRDRSSLRAFILGVAFRVRQAEVRRQMRWRSFFVAAGDDQEPIAPLEQSGEANADARRLWAALERAGEDTRLLFALRHIEELEVPEMAEVLGISVSTVKRRLARAMARIAKLFEANPEFRTLVAERASKGEPR